MQISEYPEFSWSLSRHKTILECLLKYRFSYYSSHNGWIKDADANIKHIYRLKKMTNIEMLLGTLVHEYIEKIIASGFNKNLISEKVMFNNIWNGIEKVIESSFQDYNKWYEKPSSFHMLHEIYYQNGVPVEKIEELKERLSNIIHNFFENKLFEKMKRKEVDINQDTERFRYLNRDGIKVWLKMDLHYTDPVTQKRTVVDWKTGNIGKDDRNQLALYAHYISKAYNINDLDRIEIRNEYLLKSESRPYNLKKVDIDNMKELVNLSIKHMQSYLLDIEKNIPLEETYFKKAENQTICNRCNFREICEVVR